MTPVSLLLWGVLSLGPFERNHPLVEKGQDAFLAGKYEEALRAFDEAKAALPDSAAVEFDRANTLYKLGRYEEAKAGYRQVLGLGSGELTQADWYNLGNTLAQMGDNASAKVAYRKALVQNPGDEAARHNLEALLRRPKPPPPTPDGGTDGGTDGGQGNQGGADGGQDGGTDGGTPPPSGDGGQDGGSPKGAGDAGVDGGRGDGGEAPPQAGESEEKPGDAGMPPPELGDGGLSPDEAKQLLDAVKQNEKNLQLWRFQKKKQRRPNEKDW